MDRNVNRTDLEELHTRRLPAVTRPVVSASPVDRLRNVLALRPTLARTVSDSLIVLAVCMAGLGGMVGFQRVTASQRTPLAGMAELRAQVLSLPPAADTGRGPGAAAARGASTPAPVSGARAPAPGSAASQVQGAGVPVGVERSSRAVAIPAATSQEIARARPITGEARKVVMRLTRAAGYIIPESALNRPTATLDIARMMAGVGRLVAPRVLEALQASPGNTQIVADFAVTLRGPPLDPADAVAALRAPAATAPMSTPKPLNLNTDGAKARGARDAAVSPPEATAVSPARTVPAAPDREVGSASTLAASTVEAGTAQDLTASLDDPLPVNWLQAMTEQAVTPLTPRN